MPIIISSVTAAELLHIQSSAPCKANYYPILPFRLHHHGRFNTSAQAPFPKRLFESKKHAALGKHRTDQILLDFGGKIPSVVEFGNIAISEIINKGYKDLYDLSISHINKNMQ